MKKLFLFVALAALSFTAFSQRHLPRYNSKNDLLNEEYCTGIFKTQDATYFDFVDDAVSTSALGYSNVLDWLTGRVAGLQIHKLRNNISVAYLRNQKAAIFLDEMPVSEDVISMIPVTDIAMIKIIKDPFVGGFRGPGGSIAIYTLRGDEEE